MLLTVPNKNQRRQYSCQFSQSNKRKLETTKSQIISLNLELTWKHIRINVGEACRSRSFIGGQEILIYLTSLKKNILAKSKVHGKKPSSLRSHKLAGTSGLQVCYTQRHGRKTKMPTSEAARCRIRAGQSVARAQPERPSRTPG